MSQVVSFEDYRPAARFDAIPWTQARIDEAASEDGPWTTIDTLDLDPVDSDPAHPQERAFTTENGTDASGLWYRVVFLDADDDTSLPTAPVQNTGAAEPATRDLCSLDDVKRYVPAYEPDDDTDATLQQLITSLSIDAYREIGREFTPRAANPDTRVFELDAFDCAERELEIGDLAVIDDDFAVTISDPDGTVLQTLQEGAYVALPRSRDAWAPITSLQLPRVAIAPDDPAELVAGRLVTVTGTFGFPEIPGNVREAIAKLVIVRYLTDVAATGTAFSDAMDDINLAGLFRSATESLHAWRIPVIA